MSTLSKERSMNIAVCADAHANLPALEAVLKDIRNRKIDEIWYLGDFVGYGPYPKKVINLIHKHASRVIVGNYDLNVLKFPEKKDKWKKKKVAPKYYSIRWTFKNLGPQEKDYIKNLPRQLRIKCCGKSFLFVHGSPDRIDEPLRVETPDSRFDEIAKKIKVDVLLCGHTHNYFDKRIGGVRFINPGSIGRPFDGDNRASYAVMGQNSGKMIVQNFRVAYDVNRFVKKMKREKFPDAITQSVVTGISLDEALKQRENNQK